MKRHYRTRFDRVVATAMRDSGMSWEAIGRELGVTAMAVKRALDPELRARMDDASKRHARMRRARV